jgi:hypothetical protein
LIALIHSRCHQIALFYEHMPRAGETFDIEHAYDVNGNPLNWGASRYCASCGIAIETKDLEPGPPVLRTFDMTSPQNMREFYDTCEESHFEDIA